MSTGTPTQNPFKVLFVDNSRTTRAVMSSLFEQKGYQVSSVGTGMEAIEKVKGEHFDVVVMDLYMPIMNGYEAAKHIRELTDVADDRKNVPIIALTASQDPKDMDLCKQNGMNEYVIKSDDHKGLFEAIEKYRPK